MSQLFDRLELTSTAGVSFLIGSKMATLSAEDISRAALRILEILVKQIERDVRDEPDNFLSEVRIGQRQKKALRVDINAEDTFSRELHRYQNGRFRRISVFGEERLRDDGLDLSQESEIVALVDAVDGTDLVERGLSNWCSAAVFFNPKGEAGEKIIASFVGLPSADIYFASTDRAEVRVKRGRQIRQVRGMSFVSRVENASVCFYGQKIGNWLSVGGDPASAPSRHLVPNLATLNKDYSRRKQEFGFRIYNLGGIPMMVRLIDKLAAEACGIDAILELMGQKPHDCVPGLFLAKKSGAILTDLDGQDISYQRLEEKLLQPGRGELKYLLTCTKALSDKILELVQSKLDIKDLTPGSAS